MRRGLGSAVALSLLLVACGKADAGLTVSKDQVELREGATVEVCTRTVRQPFEAGGGFDCGARITVRNSASGSPDVSEAELWVALEEAGVKPSEVGEAYLYMPQVGAKPSEAQGGMILASEPDPSSLIGNYVVELADGSLRMYVGLRAS